MRYLWNAYLKLTITSEKSRSTKVSKKNRGGKKGDPKIHRHFEAGKKRNLVLIGG